MKNYSVQSLKGICALIVFFSHALNFPDIPFIQSCMHSPLHLFFDGQLAVIVFVAISGFFYQKSLKFSVANYTGGIKKKLIRIYVPYILVTLIGALACNLMFDIEYQRESFTKWANTFWHSDIGLTQLIAHLTAILPHDTDLINPPTWYIPVEVRLFLVVPLLVMLSNRHKGFRIFYPLFIVLMAMGSFIYIGACLLGCVSRQAYERYHTSFDRFKQSNKAILKAVALMVAILLLNIRNEFTLASEISFTLQAIGAAILVPIVYSIDSPILNNRILVWFGDISYELYLIHFLVLLALRPLYSDSLSYLTICFILSLILSVGINKACGLIVVQLNKTSFFSRSIQ